ncbi:MAG: SpoVG family protein [Endomicrobia bacterium]|nr:SpoVG family protein [Endomicrobiia bacterium]MCL2507101.1 SpoVG family protein [Endomicrobiia bacterium]
MNFLKILSVFAVVLFFAHLVYADIKVTSVEKSGAEYSISFNNSIKVSGIKLINKDGKNDIEFPFYISKGVIHKQISVLNRDYRKYLINSIEKGLASDIDNANDRVSFKINKFSALKNHKSIKAFMSVIFDGLIEVECRVLSGKNGLWIAWPSVKKESGWSGVFEFTNLKLKNKVESALILYYNDKNENGK